LSYALRSWHRLHEMSAQTTFRYHRYHYLVGQFVSMQVAAVTGLVSLGYLAFGGYLLSRYEGIGVRSLSLFSGLWGGNFLSAAVVIFAFSSFGITNGAQLTQLGSQVPPTLPTPLDQCRFPRWVVYR